MGGACKQPRPRAMTGHGPGTKGSRMRHHGALARGTRVPEDKKAHLLHHSPIASPWGAAASAAQASQAKTYPTTAEGRRRGEEGGEGMTRRPTTTKRRRRRRQRTVPRRNPGTRPPEGPKADNYRKGWALIPMGRSRRWRRLRRRFRRRRRQGPMTCPTLRLRIPWDPPLPSHMSLRLRPVRPAQRRSGGPASPLTHGLRE